MMNGHNALHVETCAKQGKMFIPLDQLSKLILKDPNYVDGSIRVFASGKPLITDAEWTDVVHWWASMSNVFRELLIEGKQTAGTYFPDTAVWMGFEVAGDRLTWTVKGAELRSATLDRRDTLRTLIRAYKAFFERMKVLNPACVDDYSAGLTYLAKLELPLDD